MLQLPNVTLICVATIDVEQAINALSISCNGISYGAVKLLAPINYDLPMCPKNVKWILHVDDIDSFDSIDEWNKFIFYELYKYVDTEFCLLIHPDGYVINPDSWNPDWLNYDYIGAPWYDNLHHDIDGNVIRVGNSVSLRSKRLLELPSKLNLEWYNQNEDTAICVSYRHHFLEYGISYAPLELAIHFSKENNISEQVGIENTFCFHKRRLLEFTPENTYASYINLDSRPDRNDRMITELNRVGISAVRTRGLLPEEVSQFIPDDKTYIMQQRTPGAIGCHYSQIAVMEEALRQGKHAWVMEDDLIYCNDIQERLKEAELYLTDHDWDIFWLGSTYHLEPTWHKSDGNSVHSHPDLYQCHCTVNKDWEPTEHPNIVRTYGCWSTYSYIVNKDKLKHILDCLDTNVYRSMGIDWLMILLQPNLSTFAFNPGCVKQYDNQSNIGTGITQFSSFANLGNHWYKESI